MDTRHFGYTISSTDLTYLSYPTVPSIPESLFESLKFDSRNSPDSPFSTHFETDTFAVYSDGNLEQYSSAEALTPSSNFFLDYKPSSFFHQDSPSTISGPSYHPHPNANNTNQNIRHRLIELECALMGPDANEEATTTTTSPEPFDQARIEKHLLHGFPHNDNLKQLLIACAQTLSENKINKFEKLIEHARLAVSISGDPIQRLGAYLVEGLVARKESSGTNIYQALKCNQPDSKDLLSYMRILYEICPYFKFGYMAANGAIAEACKNEARIHIVDFQIAQGTQWTPLLQALAARPGGPPHVRITGIDDPVSKYARGDGLSAVGRLLEAISKKFKISIEFHPIPVFACEITRALLDVRPGEALAVNFPLQLHHTPDESVDVSNPRDGLLRLIKSLSPKVVTLVEQESNTNTTPFVMRFVETLDYYSAIFESIDVTMDRDKKERISVEQQCLARDIVNIIACEGKARVERHELFGKWRLRFMMAGFQQFPLSSYVSSVIRGLLRCYSEHYSLLEKDGAMLLGWKDRNLVSASAWY